MARVSTGNSAGLSGRIGDQVYVRLRGETYIRRAVRKRRDANDPKMRLNQQRFALITRFCQQFKHSVIPMIWNDAASTCSGYNLLMKANSPAFALDGSISNPLLLKLSTGKLNTPDGLSAKRMELDVNTIEVNWKKETHISGTRLKDELVAVCYDGQEFSSLIYTGIRRKDTTGNFPLPVMGQVVQYLYLFFASEDRRSFSDSLGFKI